MARDNQPQPTDPLVRTSRSPRYVFLVCAAATLVSAVIGLGLLVLLPAVVLVVTAMVLQSRGRDPRTWFAASTGVAAGGLLYMVYIVVVGQS